MKNNVVIKHSLEEYNKKYRNLRHRLLKLSKKDVEDFDKRNPIGVKNYLLNDRKWALIGDTYYEIPKAPRWTWFRNLSAGVQVLTSVLAVGVVATAVAVPLVLLNQAEPEISIDNADLVTWSNKHYDSEGNACLTIKGKDGNQIQSLELSIENYKCIENTDFTYDVTSGDLLVKKVCIDAHPGKINIKPIFKKEEKVTKAQFVAKANEWVKDGFLKETTEYSKDNVTYKENDVEQTITNIEYSNEGEGSTRQAVAVASSSSSPVIAGVPYSGDTLSNNIKEETIEGVTYTITDDYISYEFTNAELGEYKLIKINKYGYLMKKTEITESGENTTELIYKGAPQETEEGKFYKVYKNASDAFQKNTLVFDEFDIGYKYGGSSLDVVSVTYSTTGNERSATMKVAGDLTIGGGELTYYDDEDKGIKAYIKAAIAQFGLDKVEYTSDAKTGTCGFTLVKGAMSLPIMFNKDGYVTAYEAGVITYTGEAHKTNSAVECPYDTQASKYISQTSTTLGTRETLYATIQDQSMPAFDTVECPNFTLGYGTDDCDVRVEMIYLDSQGTKATYGDDYTVANNKITFTSDRTEYTLIVLKATNANGVSNLNVNAYKAS